MGDSSSSSSSRLSRGTDGQRRGINSSGALDGDGRSSDFNGEVQTSERASETCRRNVFSKTSL